MCKKILSVILSILMVLTVLPFAAAEDAPTIKIKQDSRKVYLHARGENPTVTENETTVAKGSIVDVYFAVDNPNKGRYITDEDITDAEKETLEKARTEAYNKAQSEYAVKAEDVATAQADNALSEFAKLEDTNLEENDRTEILEKYKDYISDEGVFDYDKYKAQKKADYLDQMGTAAADREEGNVRHAEPQNDMNGYTVKIYYDTDFFDLVNSTSEPIDYKVPNEVANSDTTQVKPDASTNTETVPDKGAYFYVTAHGQEDVPNSTYKAAYITVFFTGSYLPQEEVKTDEEGNVIESWYNLCKLQLKPKKQGFSDVHIEVNSADPYTLELFAKDVPEEGYAPTFEFEPMFSGYHTINIKNMPYPSTPVPSKPAGTYVNETEITLSAEEDCVIWYSLDGGTMQKYWTPGQLAERKKIKITQSTVITTYAERITTDGSLKSTEAVYRYEIIPNSPSLFHDGETGKEKVIFEKYKGQPFYVYPRDLENYAEEISESSEIYYTYSDAPFDAVNFVPGTNPDSEWVLISKRTPELLIDQNRRLRMVTYKMEKYSEVAEYRLGISPAPVTADPDTTYDCTDPFDVSLYTETQGAYIKYTTDGSNPITNGIVYTEPITVSKDVQIKAVSVIPGDNEIYSETVSTFSYMFKDYAEDRVEAFYPEGTYEESVYVTLTAQKPEYKIVYKVEGKDEDFVPYEEPLFFDKNETVTAKIVYPDGTFGKDYTFSYIIKPLPPEFAPLSTQFADTGTVIVSCMESNASTTGRYSLYYTTDGSDPTDPNNPNRILANPETDSAAIGIEEYTVISAAVLRDGEEYSEVEVHSYDIVTTRPVKPVTTLVPGYYTREIDGDDYFTEFLPFPSGTVIYYTVDYEGGPCPAPMPGDGVTKEYVPGETKIDVRGKTIIRAVAINEFNVRSDIATFTYTVVPEAPVAAPSASVYGELPVVPVKSVPGSTVYYSVAEQNDVNDKYSVEFVTPDNGEFYVDTATGNAYEDEACTKPLYPENPNHSKDNPFSSPVILNIKASLDDVMSEQNTYRYEANPVSDETVAPPYADKETGTYEEIDMGDDSVLHVRLTSLNKQDNAVIEYKFGNGDHEWKAYSDLTDGIVRMTGYTVLEDGSKAYGYNILQLRTRLDDGDGNVENDVVSNMSSYVYDFIPLPPIIEKPSGTYPQNPPLQTTIYLDEDGEYPDVPGHLDYEIYYRRNGDGGNDKLYLGERLGIDHTMSFKAYAVNDKSGKKSKNVINYYIIENASSGLVGIHAPYNVQRISASLLTEELYADGIRLYPKKVDVPADIIYSYVYKKVDETAEIPTPSYVYSDTMPILVNATMDYIKITAFLQDKTGNMITDSMSEFYIDFVHLEAPLTTLEKANPGKVDYRKGTEYAVINDREKEPNIILYYTIDGSDPTDSENPNRKIYTGTNENKHKLQKATTVKTVYFSACENEGCFECKRNNKAGCLNGIYGEVGTYQYTIAAPTGGGGGGTVTIDKTRKYTVDVFGNEHPTHINYIKGYPDGTVRPEGHITREEMAVILYRVRNKQYENPFTVTGDVFPDVAADRWSVTEIEYMANEKVIVGYPDTEFKPTGNLTRAEFAAMICRFADLTYTRKKDYMFPDVSENHWAFDEIAALMQSGYVEGYEDGTFRPENQITRAEVITVMNKILGRKPMDSYVKSLDFNPYTDLVTDQWYYTAVMEATITHNYYLNAEGFEYKWEDWK